MSGVPSLAGAGRISILSGDGISGGGIVLETEDVQIPHEGYGSTRYRYRVNQLQNQRVW